MTLVLVPVRDLVMAMTPQNQPQNQLMEQSVKITQRRMAPPGMTLMVTNTPVTGIPKVTTVKHTEMGTRMMFTVQTKHAARVMAVVLVLVPVLELMTATTPQ